MTSVTQPNSGAINPLGSSKQFLEDGEKFNEDTIAKMSEAIKNSDNLDQFLHHINRDNVNQSIASEEAATAAGSPVKGFSTGFNKTIRTTFNMRLYDPFQYLNSSDEEECTFHPVINKNADKLAKRVFQGDTNEQLYRYHTERTLKKQEFADIAVYEQSTKAYLNHSNKSSVKMILKKLTGAISKLVLECANEDLEHHLDFEALGTVLHRLGVFQNLEFTKKADDGEKSTLSINYAKVKPERLSKEIVFHENFWKILAVPTLVADQVPAELVSKVLTVLVEEKTPAAEAGAFLAEVLNNALNNVGLKGEGEQTAWEFQKEQKQLWSLPKIVTEFRQLFNNKTLFMKLYNSNQTNVLTTDDLHAKFYTQPHYPTINQKSVKIDAKHWIPKFHDRLEKHDPSLTQKDLRTRNTRLYKYRHYLQNRKHLKLESRIAEELDPCTFVPKTTKYNRGYKKVAVTEHDSLSPSRLGYFSQALAEPSVANRHLLLYEVAKTYKEKLQQKSYAFKMKEEADEMAECSFNPKTNKNFEGGQDFYEGVPRGFKKNVERLHLGNYLKETREAEIAKIPRGENYHKNKELDFTPPTFLQRPKIKKDEVLVYVDVSIGPGKTGRIGIHKGDNAKTLAKNFARTYSLNSTMKESLEKLLQSYIDSYFNQPIPQTETAEQEVEQFTDRGHEGDNDDEHVEVETEEVVHHESHEEEVHSEEHVEEHSEQEN